MQKITLFNMVINYMYKDIRKLNLLLLSENIWYVNKYI